MFRVAVAARAFAAPILALLLIALSAPTPARALEAHIFRGAGDFSFVAEGLTFSQGMDALGRKFEAAGVRARVYRWQSAGAAYQDIMTRKPDAVAIIGHSMGALASISLAKRLEGSGVRVAYLGLIDIPGPAATAPRNVEVAENFYSLFPVYGRLGAPRGHQGIVRNQFVAGQIHVTMDSSKRVHKAMLAAAAEVKSIDRAPSMQAFAGDAAPEPEATSGIDAVTTASTTHRPATVAARASATAVPSSIGAGIGDPVPLSSVAAMPSMPAAYPVARGQGAAIAPIR